MLRHSFLFKFARLSLVCVELVVRSPAACQLNVLDRCGCIAGLWLVQRAKLAPESAPGDMSRELGSSRPSD